MHHWFLPHQETHKKAHLLSWEALLIYTLLFVLLQVSFTIVGNFKPGILGTTSNIQKQQVLEQTNIERVKLGFTEVRENAELSAAAEAKARNMFEENYWAHFAPSGKSPWDFIKASGYRFTYAGENLAKNFNASEDVVTAWMNSPSHRDNIVNPKYREIGIAVEDGILNGQRTTLVVQMFGSTESLAAVPVQLPSRVEIDRTALVASLQTQPQITPLIDPFKVSKSIGLTLISFLTVLLLVDLVILRRRGILKIQSHHIAHMAVLSSAALALFNASPGRIL